MSELAADYMAQRSADPEEQAYQARRKAARDADQQEVALSRVGLGTMNDAKRLGVDILTGTYDALRNTGELVLDAAHAAGRAEMGQTGVDQGPPVDIDLNDVAPDFMREMDGLRARLNQKSTQADVFVQKAFQFALPFMGAMKAVGAVSTASTAVNALAADAVVSTAVWDPHEGRFADLLKMAAPDNTLIGPAIDYLASDPTDSDAEGRFKNMLDSQLAGFAFCGFLFAAGKTLKGARAVTSSPKAAAAAGGAAALAVSAAAKGEQKVKP